MTTDDIDKYEGIIGDDGYVDYDGIVNLLAEVKRHKNIIGKFDEFMCNNWTPENAHSLWNELLEMKRND